MKFEDKYDYLRCVRNELVPENPCTSLGINGLLDYRINAGKGFNKRHPDSLYEGYDLKKKKYYGVSITAELFRKIYKTDPFEEGSSDTIFNCWSFLSMFAKGRLNKNYASEITVKENLKYIFEGYEELKILFDKMSDYQHSMANLMPAPIGFNGNREHDGKGNYTRDNDMPDIYYQRAMYDFPRMHKWIDDNMEKYLLSCFKEYNSGFYEGEANNPAKTDSDIKKLEVSLKSAIECIENRATELAALTENEIIEI